MVEIVRPSTKDASFVFDAARPVEELGFSVGDIMRVGCKTFVLAKAGGAITSIGMGVKNGLFQGVAFAATAATSAAGSSQVTLTTAATDGAAGTGLIAKDEFKGGYIVLFTAGVDTPQIRGVTGNTSRTASGSKPVTFYLDSPLSSVITISVDHAEVMQSPWSCVVQDSVLGHPVVGVAQTTATQGQYLWVQTWGPCFVSPQAAVGVAGAVGCYWRHDGSIDSAVGTYVSSQYAGFVLAETSAQAQAAPFIMLQIVP